VAANLISQSDLSKLERRRDARLSTLRAHAKALGGRLRVLFEAGGEQLEVRLRGEERAAGRGAGGRQAPARSARR
jgi:hypothetical protein